MAKHHLKISEVIKPETIDLEFNDIENKDQAILRLVDMLDDGNLISDKEEYIKSVYEREKMGPTYMEHFIAIPHGKSDAVKEAGIAFGRSREGFQYDTPLGGGIAKMVFLLAIPNRFSADAYMAVLARLARLLVYEKFRNDLMNAKEYTDIVKAIIDGENLLQK